MSLIKSGVVTSSLLCLHIRKLSSREDCNGAVYACFSCGVRARRIDQTSHLVEGIPARQITSLKRAPWDTRPAHRPAR